MATKADSTKNPFLSIIIPVFNMAGRIEPCLRSICGQLSDEMEVLVVDDGSSDETGDAVKRVLAGDSRFHYYYQRHAGVSSARNLGIEHALGEYLLFIDADDEIEDHYLRNIVSTTKQSDADIFIWGIKRRFPSGNTEEWKPSLDGGYSRKEFLTAFPPEQYAKHKGLYGFVANKMVKAALVRTFGLRFDPSLSLMEDYDFFLDCYARSERFFCFSETGYRYTIYNGSDKPNKRKDVSYPQLIDVQIKCADLLSKEGALTPANEKTMIAAIGNLSLSLFLEMKSVRSKTIKSNLDFLSEKPHPFWALERMDTRWRLLRRLILKKRVFGILVYITIWRFYLRLRTGGVS